MKELAKSLLGSKKFVAMLVGLLAVLLTRIGLDEEMSKDVSLKVMAIVSAYLVGQGMADVGKEAAKETGKQATTTTTDAGA